MELGLEMMGNEREQSLTMAAPSGAVEEWEKFLSLCIAKRLETEQFASFVSILYSRHPLPPIALADIFLKPQPANHENLDPRVHQYLQVLTDQVLVDTPSTLKALYKYSSSQSHHQGHDTAEALVKEVRRWKSSYSQEETIFYRFTRALQLGTGIKSATEAIEMCKVMAKWMNLFTSASQAFAAHAHDVMGQLHTMQSKEDMEASQAAFVMLLLKVCENEAVLKALARPSARDARKAMSDSLGNFVPGIMQTPGASQVAGRLDFFRSETLAGFEPVDKKKEVAKAEIDDLLDSTMGLENFVIAEMPITNSRAGLYIYLNALVVGRPLIDDSILYSYLHNRYNGDIQTTAIYLILASFDVVANAFFRNEGQKAAILLRSFLINKLPLLLVNLAASMFPPTTPQFCITEALNQVDTNAFPTLSSMFDESNSNNIFTDSVRQDFCFACCLHGLIPESAIEGLLGDMTYQTLPAGGRYMKDTLVGQCMVDPERIQSLIGELDNMDGNVGAVCQALTEVIARLCNNKETMSLKVLCSQLAKKSLSLDVMLLFEKPISILHPLCELLDSFHYDEDQGEYQPVYEEFGSILLLVLAFVHRYGLSVADLGLRSPDSFIAKLLSRGHIPRSFEELTEPERAHIGGWIHGLFDTESGGLGDELMSSCPPQNFHLLVSTLFYQVVLAFSTDRLSEESLKSGVEYLVDTFLLPSLVMAITYFSNQLRVNRPVEQKAVIRILQLILLTKQGSHEAQSMLSGVLNMVAKPLEHGLRSYQRQDPKSQDVEPLLKAIKDNIRISRRSGGADHNELETWTSTQGGGLVAAVRHTLQGLVQWSLHPGINIMPTSYTHRQILASLKLIGPKRLLHIILEEVRQQTDAGSGSVAYDIATALICAPDVTNMPPTSPAALLSDPGQHSTPVQTRISLRAALRWEAEDFKKIQKADPVMAETVVRLFRRIEAQMALPPPTEMLQGGLALGLDEGAASSLGLGATQGDGLVTDGGNVDLDLGGGSGDMKFDMGSTDNGGLDLGAEDDIFGSLGGVGNGDLLGDWDNMDLS